MQEDFYMVKKILFENVPKSILTQNKNGPCPLLALANALIIKGKIHVHSDYSCVAHQDLIQMIADALMERDENVIVYKGIFRRK